MSEKTHLITKAFDRALLSFRNLPSLVADEVVYNVKTEKCSYRLPHMSVEKYWDDTRPDYHMIELTLQYGSDAFFWRIIPTTYGEGFHIMVVYLDSGKARGSSTELIQEEHSAYFSAKTLYWFLQRIIETTQIL